mmetsp:Transcript_24844/g.69580  ORF Transcript_24844/g.69580 Transcript_24844/m.69580 type:complete len:137 (-) Transcript_24844:29-439(-)
MNQFDLRTHTYRLRELFSGPEYKHYGAMLGSLVAFAKDVEEDCWFCWKAGESDEEKKRFVYAVDESAKAGRPARVARNFAEFVDKVCLGTTMSRLGIRKIPANPDRPHSEWEMEDDDDDDLPPPPQSFRPFPKPRV